MESNSSLNASITSTSIEKQLRSLPLALCALFLISGASGLIYQVVWLRMLTRTLGSTVYATSTILAVFMGGLALGSYLFGCYADRVRRPLMVYAILEAGIGLAALLTLGMNSWPEPFYRAVYSLAGDSRPILTAGQILLVATALLIPTTLMGATLPTLCAYGVRRSAEVGRTVGTLYALNTIGAMLGVLISGFVLLGEIGETRTIIVGVVINVLVAVAALLFFPNQSGDGPPVVEASSEAAGKAAGKALAVEDAAAARRVRLMVLLSFGVSGFVSLALEMIWSRMLALYLGTSVYAFTAMLGVMLAGIGVGGWIGGRVERWKDPLLILIRLELGIAFMAALGIVSFALYRNMPIIIAPLAMVGPVALLLGIAFPVAVRCYTDHANVVGRRVGELYAWNTVGCILGSLAGGFVLVPLLGVSTTGALLVVITLISALLLIAVHPKGFSVARMMDYALIAASLLTVISVGNPYRDMLYNKMFAFSDEFVVFDHVEEASATTTVGGIPENPLARMLLVNGHGMTVLLTGNKLMANLPLWLVEKPKDALVICMGMGTTFRTASLHPEIDVTVVELVPAVAKMMHYFHNNATEVLARPNAHVVVDDGRNYLLMHPKKFDVITIDPAPPLHSAGTVNLYAKEFFDLCASRTKPGGIVCLWVPVAPMSESKMVLRTFATAFPYVSVWRGPTYPGFYLMGSQHPITDVESKIRAGFKDSTVVADLIEWDETCSSPERIMALYLCDRQALLDFTQGSPVVSDDRPYTEFPMFRLGGRDSEKTEQLTAINVHQWLQMRQK